MIKRHFLVAALLVAGAVMPTVALGQTSDADMATARDLAIEGYTALESKDYTAALDRFTRADTLYHAPSVILGLARAQAGLGELVAAQELYHRAAHETLPPSASTASKKAVQDAQKELDALSLRVPSVIITVKGADAPRVTLDGIEVRAAALGVKRPVDPGKHVIIASAAGFLTRQVMVDLAEGKIESVTLDLDPGKAASARAAAGGPAAKSGPAADPIKGNGSTQGAAGVVALGFGAAGLLVGGIAGGLALGQHRDLIKSCPGGHCPPDRRASLQPTIDGYSTLGTLSTIGFLAGGALVATGVALLLTVPRKVPPPAAVTPLLGAGFLGVKGSF